MKTIKLIENKIIWLIKTLKSKSPCVLPHLKRRGLLGTFGCSRFIKNLDMMNKKAFEFSFAWIFSIIVGAVFLFLAIYAVTQLIKTEGIKQDTELGKEFGIILTPIETGLEAGKITKISMPLDARILNECNFQGNFGAQKISIQTKSLKNEFNSQGLASSFPNKYIFSEKVIEGKNYFVFSKPLELPFKIADLIYLWSENEKFCFVNPPKVIESEISDMKETMIISSSVSECSKESKKVCFASSNCDIDVSLDSSGKLRGSLKKKFSERVYFETPTLLYASIFSDSELYECQLKRLMKRSSELSWLYYTKSAFLAPKGCSSNLESELANYANKTFSLSGSLQLREIFLISEELRRRNNDLACKLF